MAKKPTTTKKTTKKVVGKKRSATNVTVKSYKEVVNAFNGVIITNVHDRFNFRFPAKKRRSMVAYGPWLAILVLIIIAPQLLILSNSAMLVTPAGFLEKILFNQEAWVILSLIVINLLTVVAALTDLFEKKRSGWNKIYVALLINIIYVAYQLVTTISQPAAPIVGLAVLLFGLFCLLDIREYYKK